MTRKLIILMLLLPSFLLVSAQARQAGVPYIKKEVRISDDEIIKILIIPHPISPLFDTVCVILSDLKNKTNTLACPEYMSGFYEAEKIPIR